MTPFKVLLADDHQDSLEVVEAYIKEHPNFEVIATCNDGEELVSKIATYKPDIVITDVIMPKLNGVEAIKKAMQFHEKLKFIFVTGYDEFAVEAFNLEAVDYIVKPVELPRLYAALEKAQTDNRLTVLTTTNSRKKLPFKFNGSMFFIPYDDIFFIEKAGKKCLIHTKEGTFETYERISVLARLLDKSFFLSHRSNIVNLDNILYIKPKNETFLAYFRNFDKHAHISKLKIKEIETLL
ncbi:MAG: LytTR family DNA-binding domain-containing protein [Paenisporosarcina sp.]|nr:LytTR family DNA-binding domain-containing protein [Paenisporosarcina sp.]